MTAETSPIVQTHSHVCLIHYGASSRRPVVLQWVREALAAGEGVVLIEPPSVGRELVELVGDGAERIVIVDPGALFGRGTEARHIPQQLVAAGSSQDGNRPQYLQVSSPAAHALSVHDDESHLEYERSLARAVDEQLCAALCQYDHVLVDADLVARAAAEHEIVVQLDDLALTTLDLRPTAEGIRVSGEIDIANHAVVTSWMSRHRGRRLIVDCSNLTFLDVAGLRALTRFGSDDAPVVLEHLNGIPARLLSALPLGSMPSHIEIGRQATSPRE
jgi:hypothetical protein